jgi:uncharacterized protein with NRDE domain
MCTVVCERQPGHPLRVLALRDEFAARDFDGPAAWWPEQPTAIGGRDRLAGGTWCASDVATGATALLVNRIERIDGTPSRGLLPLAAVRAYATGTDWTAGIDHTTMASFNLVVASPDGVVVWVWDASALTRRELGPGQHMITSRGVDPDDPKTATFAPRFVAEPWQEVVTSCEPSDEPGALVVRHQRADKVYATVFGQLITSVPGSLHVEHSRTPWVPGSWTEQSWPSAYPVV